MRITCELRALVVVECREAEEALLPPDPLHRLDYQTGWLRLEYPNTNESLVALRMCGVIFPETNDG